MANIFGGVEPPRWLQEMTMANYEHGQWGRLGGTLLSGATNALQRDPNAPQDASWSQSRVGLKAGLFETRMNQEDPMWRLRAESIKGNILGQAVQNEQQFQNLKIQNEERTSWLKAAPSISKWMAARPEDRAKMDVPETFGSTQALGLIDRVRQSDESFFIRKQQNDIRLQNTKSYLMGLNRINDWNNARNAITDPNVMAQIDQLPNNGWLTDQNGVPVGPSDAAVQYYNKWATQDGKLPDKAFQYKVTAADSARIRATQQATVAGDKLAETTRHNKATEATADKRAGAAVTAANASEKRANAYSLSVDERKRHNQEMEKKLGEGADPKFKTLPNGTTIMWMPGSKYAQVLKDPKQEFKAKAALEEYKQAAIAYREAVKNNLTGKPEKVAKESSALEKARSGLESMFHSEVVPAADDGQVKAGAGNSQPSTPSSNDPLGLGAKQASSDPLGIR